MAANMICTQRLYQTADRSELVPEGDAKASFLYATPGDEIPASAVELYGLVDGALPEKKAGKEKKAPAETKPADNPQTKPATTPANKGS
ncbi:MAG: hypothetical protein ACK4IS_07305 [Erythrobacter sp.]